MKDLLDYNILPENYSIKIKLEEDHFTGEEKILLNVERNTKEFNFNVWKMDLFDLVFKYKGKLLKPRLEIQEEVATLYFDEELKAKTQGHLCLKYKGVYSDDMLGLCKSKYYDDVIFFTDFEPTGARRVFPCYDQPDMKATFDISVSPLYNYAVVSNTLLKEERDGYFVFNTTPKMPTYTVSFVSGELSGLKARTKRNIPVSVFAHEKDKVWGNNALFTAIDTLDFFEEYFGILYPLPKLDLVCIPTLRSKSIGNWGLMTFQTNFLLLTPFCSHSDKKSITETVCHEVAHMWFRNLVTMTWWNDKWLEEAFATWAASLAMTNLEKDLVNWDVRIDFMERNIERGLIGDCLDSSYKLDVGNDTHSSLGHIVINITRFKAASVIRMLEGVIGKEDFKKGIRQFFKKYQFANATLTDFCNSFNPTFCVKDFLDDWISIKGYPLVTVTEEKNNECNLEKGKSKENEEQYLVIKQKQFLLPGKETDAIWKLPISFSWGENIIMTEKEIRVKKQKPVYKINMGGFGFFRTLYDIQNLNNLLKTELDSENKFNLINDIKALCNAKLMKVDDVLNLYELCVNETNPQILTSIFSMLDNFSSLWYDNENVLKRINKIGIDIIGSRILKIDIFVDEPRDDFIVTGALLVGHSLKFEDNRILDRLKKAYSRWGTVCPDFTLCVFISVVNEKYNEFFNLMKQKIIIIDKIYIVSSLAYISDPKILLIVLKRYKELEPSIAINFFNNLACNVKNREIIVNFLCDDFDDIRKFLNNDAQFSNVIGILGLVSTEQLAKKVIDLLLEKKDEMIKDAVEVAIARIKWNIGFKEFNNDLNKMV